MIHIIDITIEIIHATLLFVFQNSIRIYMKLDIRALPGKLNRTGRVWPYNMLGASTICR